MEMASSMFRERITTWHEFWCALLPGIGIGLGVGVVAVAMYLLTGVHVSDSAATLLAGLFGALLGAGITVGFGYLSGKQQRKLQLLDELRRSVLEAMRDAATEYVPERIAPEYGRVSPVWPAETKRHLGTRPDAIRIRALSRAVGDRELIQKSETLAAHLGSTDVFHHTKEAMSALGSLGEQVLERIVEIETGSSGGPEA
jgi:hypothetical protein